MILNISINSRILRILIRLLMLDGRYWGHIYRVFIRQIKELINAVFDHLYIGKFLGGVKRSEYLRLNFGAKATQSTDYFVLKQIFSKIKITSTDVLVDVGCGKGRVLLWWLKHLYNNKLIGIELNQDIANDTKELFERFDNVSIICGNILDNVPADGNVYYLYNPFEEWIIEAFKNALLEKFYGQKEYIAIVYYNCIFKESFQNDSRWIVHVERLKHPFLCKLMCVSQEIAIIKMKQ